MSSVLRILVADDHFDSADALAMVLHCWGHEVCVARGGREALDLARSFRPHVAILDLNMPDLDGGEVARALRRQPADARPVLVAYSAVGADGDLKEVFDFELVKPQPLEDLETVLKNCAALVAGGEPCRHTE